MDLNVELGHQWKSVTLTSLCLIHFLVNSVIDFSVNCMTCFIVAWQAKAYNSVSQCSSVLAILPPFCQHESLTTLVDWKLEINKNATNVT